MMSRRPPCFLFCSFLHDKNTKSSGFFSGKEKTYKTAGRKSLAFLLQTHNNIHKRNKVTESTSEASFGRGRENRDVCRDEW